MYTYMLTHQMSVYMTNDIIEIIYGYKAILVPLSSYKQ